MTAAKFETITTSKGFVFEVYTDASGFTGSINVRGDVFSVNYTNRANVNHTNGSAYRRTPRWKGNWARKIAEEFAATLPAEWKEANRIMYA